MKSNNKLLGLGTLTAITASLCCITPVFALLAGTTGIASTFSWLDPIRPYLIGFTVLVLGFLWYQKLKPTKEIDCDCENEKKPRFIQSKTFLGIVTMFAIVMLAFPSYAHVFYPKAEKQIVVFEKSTASYENGNAIIEFDNSKTDIMEIETAINRTGYSVTDKIEN